MTANNIEHEMGFVFGFLIGSKNKVKKFAIEKKVLKPCDLILQDVEGIKEIESRLKKTHAKTVDDEVNFVPTMAK